MAKRKLPFEDPQDDDTLTGYIYDISDVTLSQSGKVKYFTAKFQQSKDLTRKLVSFVAEKHSNFVTAAESESPVKLKNVKLSPGTDGNISVIVQKNSELTVSAKPLPFRKSSHTSPVLKTVTANEVTIKEIKENGSEDMKVTIHAKFLGFTEDSTVVHTRFGEKTKRAGLIADANNDSIKLTVWGDISKSLEQGSSYKIINGCIKKFEGQLTVSTISTTSFVPATQIDSEVDLHQLLMPEEKTIEITHLQIKSAAYCLNKKCKAPVNEEISGTIFKCAHCHFKMNCKLLTKSLKTTMYAEDDLYNISHNVIEKYLTNESRLDLIRDPDRLEDFLLEQAKFRFELSPNSNTVINLESVN